MRLILLAALLLTGMLRRWLEKFLWSILLAASATIGGGQMTITLLSVRIAECILIPMLLLQPVRILLP